LSTPEASPDLEEYIRTHTEGTEGPVKGVMSRYKNSSENFQMWRMDIKPTILEALQNDDVCRDILGMMGHKVFKDMNEVTNLDVPLFT